MSQNDKLLLEKGLPVLDKVSKNKIRAKWQRETWDDMLLSLNSYGKYIMLRPTGFGKTYTCACACNIGSKLDNNELRTNNGAIINNNIVRDIHKKKIVFVYVSDILKQTFEQYDSAQYNMDGSTRVVNKSKAVIKSDNNGKSRIIYETYSMVAKHWNDEYYLRNVLDIENVGLIIFDEVQRMGAKETANALEFAMPFIEKLNIPYIGATATVERATGLDVCDKYFTYKHNNTSKITYCWGEHIYTLADCFNKGLLIPPEYQYIEENKTLIKKARQTRKSMLQELKVEYAEATDNNNEKDKKAIINEVKELQRAIIKDSDKIIHDTMIKLYDCDECYITDKEELEEVTKGTLSKPDKLPSYMRFMVFTPDRASMSDIRRDEKSLKEFGGMVKSTVKDFKDAFERYGYKVRYTIISSTNKTEKENVKWIDNHLVDDDRAIVKRDMTIDLIFSINMLNVGYHVNDITGLIFKRWTGSNQVYYQQLGRCLSADNDNIPVVFDFVKSIDSRGITAPLFTIDKNTKEVTENADGTQNTIYKDNKTDKQVKNQVDKVNLAMDNDGNLIDPRKCNIVDAKYITVSMTSASVDEILNRNKVYLDRKTAIKLYEHTYKLYDSFIEIKSGKVTSNLYYLLALDSSLRLTINILYGAQLNNISINFASYLEYLKQKEKTIYVIYNNLVKYESDKEKGNKFNIISHEINSILAASKVNNDNHGVSIKILVDQLEYAVNKETILKFIERYNLTEEDIVVFDKSKCIEDKQYLQSLKEKNKELWKL